MSIATLREAIIAELRIANQAGRTYPAPAAWSVDNANANAKALAECLARAIIPEFVTLPFVGLTKLALENFPAAQTGVVLIFADLQGRILKRNSDGVIEEINSTDYR